MKYYISILSWLLHHANKLPDKHFYVIKDKILGKYGTHLGYDVQYIEGKKCFSCGGTGIHVYCGWDGEVYDEDYCWNCHNGWYKKPVWNVLSQVQFGNYVFHQPFKRVYEKPDIPIKFINGYIEHEPTKYSRIALTILFLLFEKGYLKRWYNETGNGWRIKWYYPKNWIRNVIHIIKNGKNSYPLHNIRSELPF